MSKTAMRIACLVALTVTMAALGAPSLANAGASPQTAPSAAPVAAIDLGELFGNENEPDENEPEEGGAEGGKSAGGSGQASDISVPVTIVLVFLALFAGGYIAIRVRRLWLRLRGWGSDLRARL